MANMYEPLMFTEIQRPMQYTMPDSMKRAWIHALRHGGFVQVTGVLTTGANQFCALGLLQFILGIDPRRFSWIMSPHDAQYIASMNDNGSSFAEIADWIEANL